MVPDHGGHDALTVARCETCATAASRSSSCAKRNGDSRTEFSSTINVYSIHFDSDSRPSIDALDRVMDINRVGPHGSLAFLQSCQEFFNDVELDS